eukprot:TRINITY_DN139_c1_g6_i2.p1 TRINITY_DN139_c1_g6~~TRINITY_DN139_c1_g6_i2.p1  ORF type:complete len:558 (+),score=129.46 TRINITY_DN139_c1_g6_i2:35-1675(+)
MSSKKPAWGSRSEDVYEKIEMVGKGTFGKVYKAREKATKEYVAMKMIRMENEVEGFPITAIREIKILKELNHPQIVDLKEIVTGEDDEPGMTQSIYLVFEFMDHDLAGLLDSSAKNFIGEAQAKCYMKQLFEGLAYLHRNNILHRDIKASNLLVNNEGILKIADFGLARPTSDDEKRRYTNKVCTWWYRQPELLLSAQQYGPEVDMWSAGCIMVELLDKRPVFPAPNEIALLNMIYKLVGTPTEESWPGFKDYPNTKMFQPTKDYPDRLAERYSKFSPRALKLVRKLLSPNPKMRPKADVAISKKWFFTQPVPAKPHEMPAFPSSHEYTTKARRKKRNSQQQQPLALKRARDAKSSYRPPNNNRPNPALASSAMQYSHGVPQQAPVSRQPAPQQQVPTHHLPLQPHQQQLQRPQQSQQPQLLPPQHQQQHQHQHQHHQQQQRQQQHQHQQQQQQQQQHHHQQQAQPMQQPVHHPPVGFQQQLPPQQQQQQQQYPQAGYPGQYRPPPPPYPQPPQQQMRAPPPRPPQQRPQQPPQLYPTRQLYRGHT